MLSHELSSFSNTIFEEGCLFSITFSCLQLIDHMYKNLFQGSLFKFHWSVSVFVLALYCSNYCSPVVYLKIRAHYTQIVILPQHCFVYSGVFYVSMDFGCCFSFNNAIGIFDRDCIEFVVQIHPKRSLKLSPHFKNSFSFFLFSWEGNFHYPLFS